MDQASFFYLLPTPLQVYIVLNLNSILKGKNTPLTPLERGIRSCNLFAITYLMTELLFVAISVQNHFSEVIDEVDVFFESGFLLF